MKKLWSVLLVLTLLFTFCFPSLVLASTNQTTIRLSGNDRYDTSAQIALNGWSSGSEDAVIACGSSYYDALSATPLAKKLDAPILLTESSSLTPVTKQALQTLKVKNVYIIGGTGILSSSIDTELQSMGINTQRIFGQTLYDTNIEIAKRVATTPSKIFVCTSEDFADSLSVSPVASMEQEPIILVPNDNMPQSVSDYINANSTNITTSYVIGYSDEINDIVANQFPNPQRILGSDRYSRNIAINQKFNDIFDKNYITLASGEQFPDALSGSALASKLSSPIVLVNNSPSNDTKSYYQQRISDLSKIYIFGGAAVVPDSIVSGLSSSVSGDNDSNSSSGNDTSQYDQSSPSSFTNPYPLNTTQTINVKTYSKNYTAQIMVEQIIRGQQAWDMIYKANKFNDKPKDGYEYILAKINVKLLNIDNGKSLNINGNMDFKLVSQNGRSYDDYYSVVEPEPRLDSNLYQGAYSEGWVAFLVKTDDLKPVISYGTDYDGSGGVWFKAYGDTNTSTSTNSTNISNTSIPTPPTDINELQGYLNNNFSTLEVAGKKMNFNWKVNNVMVTNAKIDIQVHPYIDADSYVTWVNLCSQGHGKELNDNLLSVFKIIQIGFPKKSVWLDGILECSTKTYPYGFNAKDVSYNDSTGNWDIFHSIISILDMDGKGGNDPVIVFDQFNK